MAANVAQIPTMQPMKDVVKQGNLNYFIFVSLFEMHLSISNFKHNATNIPGITISPRPSILNFYTPQLLRQGNNNLMGISSFLATVTITSVPQTQKISQKNKNQSNKNPTLKLARSIFLNAIILNSTPNTLFNAQYLVTQQKITGMDTIIVQIIVAGVKSKSQIYNRDFRNFGGFTRVIILRYCGGNGRLTYSKLLVEITVAMLNWIVSNMFTNDSLTYLYIRQKPNKNADATSGNLMASFCPMRSLSLLLSLSSYSVLSVALFNLVLMTTPRQTQQQLLTSNCTKTGNICRNPPMLAARISTEAIVLSSTNIALGFESEIGCDYVFS